MRYTNAILILATAATATAQTLKKCAADNCLRAIRATAFPTRPGTADCSSYFKTTVTPTISVVIEVVTPTTYLLAPIYTTTIPIGAETAVETPITVSQTAIPAYASPCNGPVRYSSACSCINVSAQTITAPAPTTTITATNTISQTDTSIDVTTATVTGFVMQYQNGNPGAYVVSKPEASNSYNSAQFTLNILEATVFYLHPDGSLKTDVEDNVLTANFGVVPSLLYFGAGSNPIFCAINAFKILKCKSGEYDIWGTYAWNYAALLGRPDSNWAAYAGEGFLTVKAVPPPV